MFENLKAFIRHGKHANEKHGFTGSFSENLNLPVSDDLYDDISKNYLQNQNYESHPPNNNQPSNRTLVSVDNDSYGDSYGESAETKVPNYTTNNQHHEAAAKIVEQEMLQRKQASKYPNLNNYQVLEQLGEGAFSIVYRARNITNGQYVAIKILRKFQMDNAQKQAVLKEVTIMRQLDHENITSFIEFIDSEPYYYIVQELAEGGEIFAAIVKYTYLSEELSRHIILQVAHAVRYLHEEVGIVHRDIKPENLLYYPIDFKPSPNPAEKLRKSDDPNSKLDEGIFTPGVGGGTIGLVKLADFGLSKQIWEHNTKTPCGTVGYTAPEIVRDERYSKEVDMWAIGCVLYTLLCGFPPFYDERIDTLTEKVAKGEYTFLSPWWDEISVGAKHCVSKLLTVDPRKRYTIDEFLSDPWITQSPMQPPKIKMPTVQSKKKHPIQEFNNKYNEGSSNKKVYNSGMYSPAAVAMRDAFDISTAVHRMGEEARLTNPVDLQDFIEEEEEDEAVSRSGRVLETVPHKRHHHQPQEKAKNMFELNLGGASILERRKNKPLVVST